MSVSRIFVFYRFQTLSICRLAKVCKICLILAVFISYGLQGYVIVDIVWLQKLKSRAEGKKHECCYEYTVRYAIVVASGMHRCDAGGCGSAR